jgi:hypothetical protein
MYMMSLTVLVAQRTHIAALVAKGRTVSAVAGAVEVVEVDQARLDHRHLHRHLSQVVCQIQRPEASVEREWPFAPQTTAALSTVIVEQRLTIVVKAASPHLESVLVAQIHLDHRPLHPAAYPRLHQVVHVELQWGFVEAALAVHCMAIVGRLQTFAAQVANLDTVHVLETHPTVFPLRSLEENVAKMSQIARLIVAAPLGATVVRQ